MKVEILTLFKSLFSLEVHEVILPGQDGEFSVWDTHEPCLYSLRSGRITMPGIAKSVAIKTGIAVIGENKLTALVEV